MLNPVNKLQRLTLILLGVLLLGVFGCREQVPEEDLTFDRSALANNFANNLLVPGFAYMTTEISQMESALNSFVQSPTGTSLTDLQTAFTRAYLAWVETVIFDITPDGSLSLQQQVNRFPADTALINSGYRTGVYDFGNIRNVSAKGFPAVDYLLYGIAPDPVGVLAAYQDANQGPLLMTYLQDVVQDIKALVGQVQGEWTSSSVSAFVEDVGTAGLNSIPRIFFQLYNELETLRKGRIGVPLGIFSGMAEPQSAEGVYSGLSLELMRANFEAIVNMYYGVSRTGIDGYGFHDALIEVEAMQGENPLADVITAQIEVVGNAIAAIPGPYSETVVTSPSQAEQAFSELQNLIILFKVDISSNLSIPIIYGQIEDD